MNYAFHPEAKAELNEAVDYYNGCQPELGLDFAREVYAAIQNTLRIQRRGHLSRRIPGDAWCIDFPMASSIK
jgi:hypothetical protein